MQDRLYACLAEYECLRTEMEWLIRHGNQYQNFAIGLVAAAIGAGAWVFDKPPTLILLGLLALPFLFCVLGFLFFREHEEIYVIAAYLAEHVRPQVRSLAGDDTLWGWEEFKHERTGEMYKGRLSKALSTSRMILMVRTSLFLIPSILALLAVLGYGVNYVTSQGICQFMSSLGGATSLLFAIGFLFDATIVSLFIVYVWTQGNLPSRILRLDKSEVENGRN